MANGDEKSGREVYVFKLRNGGKVYETIYKYSEIRHYLRLHDAILAQPANEDQTGKADGFS